MSFTSLIKYGKAVIDSSNTVHYNEQAGLSNSATVKRTISCPSDDAFFILLFFFSTCNVEIDGVDDLKTDVTQLYTQRVGDYAIFHNVNLITRHLLSRNKPSHLIKRCLRHLPDVKWHKPIKEDEEQNKFVNQKKIFTVFHKYAVQKINFHYQKIGGGSTKPTKHSKIIDCLIESIRGNDFHLSSNAIVSTIKFLVR